MENGRCNLHGGLSTGAPVGNTNAIKHGFYSASLMAGEEELLERAAVGTLDDEIKLLRVKLHRLVRLSGSAEVAELIDSAIEVAQKHDTNERIGKFAKSEIRAKAPQYGDLIIQAVEQLRKMEMTRLQMRLAEQQLIEGGDGAGDVTGFEVVVISPDEDVPEKPIL